MSIVDKLTKTYNGKKQVVESVNNKAGSTLADTCKWSELSETIDNISTGTETTDATATANDILLGKTAYVGIGKVEGTIETYDGENEGGSSEDYLEALCNNTLTSYSNSNITNVREYLFYKNTNLESVNLPNVTQIGMNAFYNCYNLVNINLPNVTSISNYAFGYCKKLESVDLPLVTKIGQQSFYNCIALKSINLPLVTSVHRDSFQYCTNLKTAYFNVAESIGIQAFTSCTSLTDIYLGYDGVVSLANTNAFNSVSNGCKIHVKSAYADQYATATNWSSLIANGTIVIVGDYSE